MTDRIVTPSLVAAAFGAGILVGSGNSALPPPPVVPDVPGVVQVAPGAPLPGHVLVPIAPLPDQQAEPDPETVKSPPFGPPPAPEPLAPRSEPEAPKVEPKGYTCPTPCNPQPCRRRWFRR